MASSSSYLNHLLLFLLLFLFLFLFTQSSSTNVAAMELRPVGTGVQSKLVSETYRRKLGSFQICALCTCCGGPKGLCLPSPCCYSINCNIPNRPFGFCAFTPKTCNCLGCHL